MLSRLSLIPPHRDEDEDDVLKLHDGVSTETREITIAASPQRPSGSAAGAGSPSGGSATGAGLDELLGGNHKRPAPRIDDSPATTGQIPEVGAPERQPGRPKRSSVPSWDEIVFGTRGD